MKNVTFQFPAYHLAIYPAQEAGYDDEIDEYREATPARTNLLATAALNALSQTTVTEEQGAQVLAALRESGEPSIAGRHDSELTPGDPDVGEAIATLTMAADTPEAKDAAMAFKSVLENNSNNFTAVADGELLAMRTSHQVLRSVEVKCEGPELLVTSLRTEPVAVDQAPSEDVARHALQTAIEEGAGRARVLSATEAVASIQTTMESLGVPAERIDAMLDMRFPERSLNFVETNLDRDAIIAAAVEANPTTFAGADLESITASGALTLRQAVAVEAALLNGAGSPGGTAEPQIMVQNVVGATVTEWRTLLEQAPDNGVLTADRAADLLEMLSAQTAEGSTGTPFSDAVTRPEAMELGHLGTQILVPDNDADQTVGMNTPPMMH